MVGVATQKSGPGREPLARGGPGVPTGSLLDPDGEVVDFTVLFGVDGRSRPRYPRTLRRQTDVDRPSDGAEPRASSDRWWPPAGGRPVRPASDVKPLATATGIRVWAS